MIDCNNCSEPNPESATWCEACGEDLAGKGTRTCSSCGAQEVSDEDYCMACGYKAPSARDHEHFADGSVVGISDRGKRHSRNEDAIAVGLVPDGSVVIVVCDGVSSTPGSDAVSIGAVIAARNELVTGLNAGKTTTTDVERLIKVAAEAAQKHAAATPAGPRKSRADSGGPPSATFVAGVVVPAADDQLEITVGWLGDSRAYWLDGESSTQLTIDHSIEGSLSRWLGGDSPNPEPEIATFTKPIGGRLLVCSDGLWRYAEDAVELAGVVSRLESEAESQDVVQALVAFANEAGGHDNISVGLWPASLDSSDSATNDPTTITPEKE